MKIKLVLQPEKFTSFNSSYLESLWGEYFDIELYDETTTYAQNVLFVFWWMDDKNPQLNRLFDQGHKIVIDNLWETHKAEFDKFYQLNNPNWWWWNESLWWSALGYDQYVPNKNYKKIALMPIRRDSQVRDLIVKKMLPWLDQMIWSYKDRSLPNDRYIDKFGKVDQRFMNPQWFDDTYINLVVENSQIGLGLIVSEKTYTSSF
jgi:hypothetical protein